MTVLTVTFPLFALVLAGFIAFRKGILSAEGVKGIANFAFFFALPVLMFKLMSELDFGDEFNGRFFVHWSIAGLVAYVFGMTVSRSVPCRGFVPARGPRMPMSPHPKQGRYLVGSPERSHSPTPSQLG